MYIIICTHLKPVYMPVQVYMYVYMHGYLFVINDHIVYLLLKFDVHVGLCFCFEVMFLSENTGSCATCLTDNIYMYMYKSTLFFVVVLKKKTFHVEPMYLLVCCRVRTTFSESTPIGARLRDDRPFLLVSSTSWTGLTSLNCVINKCTYMYQQ